MDPSPEYIAAAKVAQDWIRENHPELFGTIEGM